MIIHNSKWQFHRKTTLVRVLTFNIWLFVCLYQEVLEGHMLQIIIIFIRFGVYVVPQGSVLGPLWNACTHSPGQYCEETWNVLLCGWQKLWYLKQWCCLPSIQINSRSLVKIPILSSISTCTWSNLSPIIETVQKNWCMKIILTSQLLQFLCSVLLSALILTS